MMAPPGSWFRVDAVPEDLMLTLGLLFLADPHGDLDLQIEKLGESIRAQPASAELHLRRAELHRAHEDWPAARSDYLRARELDPALAETDLGLGRVELAAGRPEESRRRLDLYLQARPDSAPGLVERARARHALGDDGGAVRDYDRGLALWEVPRPDHFIERCRFARPLGFDRALAGLDEGLRRLGPLVTLLEEAVRLETEAGRLEQALARVDLVLASLPRKDRWLERRGHLLSRLGRSEEATAAFEAGLREIESLPAARRQARETADLEARLRRMLGLR
jgi:predicted Zn-dependent protease